MKLKLSFSCLLLSLLAFNSQAQEQTDSTIKFDKMAVAIMSDTIPQKSGENFKIIKGLTYITDGQGDYIVGQDTIDFKDKNIFSEPQPLKMDTNLSPLKTLYIAERSGGSLKLKDKESNIKYSVYIPKKDTLISLAGDSEISTWKSQLIPGDQLYIFPGGEPAYLLRVGSDEWKGLKNAQPMTPEEEKEFNVVAIVWGALALLVILAAVWFFFIRGKKKGKSDGNDDILPEEADSQEEDEKRIEPAREKKADHTDYQPKTPRSQDEILEQLINTLSSSVSQEDFKDYSDTIFKLKQKLENGKIELNNITRAFESQKAENSSLNETIDNLNRKLDTLNSRIDDIKAEEAKKWSAEVEKLKTDVEKEKRDRENSEKKLNNEISDLNSKNSDLSDKNHKLNDDLNHARKEVAHLTELNTKFSDTFKDFPSVKQISSDLSAYFEAVENLQEQAVSLLENLSVVRNDKGAAVVAKALKDFKTETKNSLPERNQLLFEARLIVKTSFDVAGTPLSQRLASQGVASQQAEDLKYFVYERFSKFMGESVKLADILKHLNDFPGVDGIDISKFENAPQKLIDLLEKFDISVKYVELYTSTENYTDKEIDVVDTVENSGKPMDTIVAIREMGVNYGQSDKKTEVVAQM
ncbi:MAG: hypothetical protein J1F38_00635 [Muribaculaceae bacterium]|nr:hypothetical protein [Muribaculaceae bacterium]